MSKKSIRKIQAEGIAMMRAGLNKLPAGFVPPVVKWRMRNRARRIDMLYLRQNGICHLCGELMTMAEPGAALKPRDANIDHYVPRSKGGSNALSNVRAAHYECNSLKGSKFYQSVSEPEQEMVTLC